MGKIIVDSELRNIYGGFSKSIVLGIAGSIITFVIGLIDGYLRPLGCNK